MPPFFVGERVFFRIILIILAVFMQSINAAQVLGVLEIVPKDEVNDISVSEIQHLTDELRKQATQVLPQKEFSVLTRDNIIALIPSDETEAECLAESCAVDIGRAIAAEYVTYGKIGKFSGEYSLSIELYETMGGKLLGSIVMESPDIKGLLIAIREHSPKLLGKITPDSVPVATPIIRLAVLEPEGKGIAKDDQWILSLVQGSIIGDFNKYSGITVIDRQSLEKEIGNLTNASHILKGAITKTSKAFMLEFSITEISSGERKASYSPKQVSFQTLEDLSAVKEATIDLLKQFGVELTSEALGELKQKENETKIQAETALARGITAQKQGTEVAALSYFYQAATLDPSLLEAANRSSVMAVNISSGNIGDNTRNDILWRKQWVARLTETEQFFDKLSKENPLPYILFYSAQIIPGEVNYKTETQTLKINTNLRPSRAWVWLSSVEKSLQAVYDGLEATGRKKDWGLERWPWRGVTDLKPFGEKEKTFSIIAELVGNNKVIGKTEFKAKGKWSFEYTKRGISENKRPIIFISKDDMKLVNFDVKANDISDKITIRVAKINDIDASVAAKKGILQVKAISDEEWNENLFFEMLGDEITEYNKGKGGDLVIPDILWTEPVNRIGYRVFARPFRGKFTSITIPSSVTIIGNQAFYGNQLTSVTIPNGVTYIGISAFEGNQITSVDIPNSVTYLNGFDGNKLTSVNIPNGVTYIGNSAFKRNQLTSVDIPNSVTRIGNSAFENNRLTSVTIPNSVTYIGDYAFASGEYSPSKNRLTSVDIPNSVTYIGSSAFERNQLTSITIPNSVTYIGIRAFYGNPLTSITIGENVEVGKTDDWAKVYEKNGRSAGTYVNVGCDNWRKCEWQKSATDE